MPVWWRNISHRFAMRRFGTLNAYLVRGLGEWRDGVPVVTTRFEIFPYFRPHGTLVGPKKDLTNSLQNVFIKHP